MSKTKRIIAAVTAAIITATSTSLMSVCADDNGGSDLGFISKSTTDKSDKIEKVESDAQLYDKLGQLLKQGDLLKYGEALYTTGTPDGEKWTKEFYEQRVEVFGKDLLSKYIVDGEFLRKSVESDMNGLLIKTANELDKYVDVINEFLTEKSIAGSAYLIKNDGIDKLLITYDGNLDKIKTFVNETGLDENLVVYSQAEDMVVTKPAATIAVTETKPATTITMPVLAEPNVKASVATVKIMDVSGDTILVKPLDGSIELKSSDKFSLSAKQLPADITPKAGMMLEITYNGGILETYPAMFDNIQKVTVVTESDTVKEDVTLLKGTKDMTMKDLIELAKKGSDLDWADFKDYNGRDIGSGLYIWEYKLEDGYVLDVGGTTDKKPIYILLSHDDDKGIDIRTNDVKEYIASTTVPVVNENEAVTYKIITPPDKTVYKVGESISLKGIQVEMKKGNEDPVVYAYPDVAFDYQSNIPKAPTVCLSGEYKRDKVGTVAIKVVGSDDVLFTVVFVDDSTEKTQVNSVMLTTESGDDGCSIHLDLMSGTFTMSGSIYQNFAVFGKFERKGNDLYLYAENGSTNVYVLHREDDHFISQSDESGIRLTKGLVFSAENDTFWEKLTSTNESTVKGDANCDGQVDLSDAVMIMQALANPNKYGLDGTAEHHLTEQGKLNGDMNGDGLTSGDALAIQRKLLGLDDEEKSFSATLLGIDKAKVIGVKVSSLPEGYDYSFTDENAQAVVDYLSNISLSTNLSVEDPGQLGGMTWVIKLNYENGDTVTLYDLGKFIHGTDRKWYEMTYEESQELSNLIWKLGQTDNDVTPSEPTTIGFSNYEEYKKYIEENNLADKIVTYDKLSQYGEFVQFTINSHWMYDNTFSLFYIFNDGSGKNYDLIINDRPQQLEDLVAYPKLTDDLINKSDMRTANTDADAYYEFDNKYYIYTNGKLSQIKWFDDKHIYILIGNPMLYDYPKVDNTYMSKLLDISSTTSTDNSVIAGKIFAYEKEGAGGYCTLSFNENGRFLYSPGKLSSYMGGGDWKIDGDTVSLMGMVDKTIYLKITDDTLVYIAEGSDEFPYMDIKDGEKFGIYRPEISSDYFQLNSRYSEYGLGNPKVELNLIASELPEFCYVENVRLYDEDDNFIGMMSPAMDADIWSYLVDCNITEECSKTYYTLTKIRCGQKTHLDDVRSEITVNFKVTPAP